MLTQNTQSSLNYFVLISEPLDRVRQRAPEVRLFEHRILMYNFKTDRTRTEFVARHEHDVRKCQAETTTGL